MLTLANNTNLCAVPIEVIKFPAGETLVSVATGYIFPRNSLTITLKYKGSDDIMNLFQLVDVLKKEHSSCAVHLNIPYVPYARQDRRANVGDSHSLAVFASLINSIGFESITLEDPHSDVVEALFPYAHITRQWEIANLDLTVMQRRHIYDAVVSPDAGASKKAQKLADLLCVPLIQCTKERDPASGQLSNPRVQLNPDVPTRPRLLVVDDICDGGYTFIQLAAKIEEVYADNINLDLWVTHGIFSKGLDVVQKHYDNVMCHNKIYEWEN